MHIALKNIQNIAPLAVIVQYSFDLVIWIGRSLWWVLLPIPCFVPKTLKIKYKRVHLHFGWRISIIISKGIRVYGQKFVFSFSRNWNCLEPPQFSDLLDSCAPFHMWVQSKQLISLQQNQFLWSMLRSIQNIFMLSWTLLPNADTELHKQIAEIVSIVLKTQQKC